MSLHRFIHSVSVHVGRMVSIGIGILCLMACWPVPASAQLVTWVKPSADAEADLEVESVAEGVTLSLKHGETGEPIDAVGDRGWTFEDGPFGPVLRSGKVRKPDGTLVRNWSKWGAGREVAVTVANLPPGKHEVYIRYWAEAPGSDQQWYVLKAGLGDGDLNWQNWTGRIVRGLGGYEGALYEKQLGTVGGEDDSATEVTFRFNRYRYGAVARFGGVRIETELNADAPRTGGAHLSDAKRRIRQRLLEQGPRGEDGEPAYGMGVVPASLKVRPKTFDALTPHDPQPAFDLAGARGEYVNRQLIIFSPERDLKIESLEVGPLTHADSDETIPADEVMFAPVGHVYHEQSFDLDAHGWWPEPILSFLDGDFEIRQGDVQTLWLRVHVPRDAPAGRYEGNVTVRPGDGGPVATVPVTLEVHAFDLPRKFSFRTVFGSAVGWFDHEFLLDHGINPSGIYSRNPPKKEKLQAWAEDGRVTAFNVMHTRLAWLDGDNRPTEDQLEQMLDEIGRCLEAAESVGLRDEAYFYMFDESTGEALPAMRMISDAVAERFPNLLMLTTAHVSPGKLPHLKGWVPRIPKYNFDSARRARKEHDRQVWWYTANTPRPPYPNFFVTQPAMAHRLVMGAMAFAYQSDGFLYYSLGQRYRNVTIKRIYTPNAKAQQHGQLFQRGPNGPLPSIRLEMFRAGLQDYEYLKQATELAAQVNLADAPEHIRRIAERLDTLTRPGADNPLVRNFRDYSHDPEPLTRIRRELAAFIAWASPRADR